MARYIGNGAYPLPARRVSPVDGAAPRAAAGRRRAVGAGVRVVRLLLPRERRGAAEQRYGAWSVGSDAVRALAAHLTDGQVADGTRGHLINFALPLGAKRADDYAEYFGRHDRQLATAKHRQAGLFGRGHVHRRRTTTGPPWPLP